MLARPSATADSLLTRDFELESFQLGPATRIVTVQSDPQGGVFYQFAQRDPHSFQLPIEFGSATLTLIDRVQTTAVLDPRTWRLIAFAASHRNGSRTVLLGRNWGAWIDETGAVKMEKQIIDRMEQWCLPLAISTARRNLALDFTINQHNPDAFPKSVSALLRGDAGRHLLKLIFAYPSGEFQGAQLTICRPNSEQILQLFGIEEFPIVAPGLNRSSVPGVTGVTPAPAPAAQTAPNRMAPPRPAPAAAPAQPAAPQPGPAPQSAQAQSGFQPHAKSSTAPGGAHTPPCQTASDGAPGNGGFTHRPVRPMPGAPAGAQAPEPALQESHDGAYSRLPKTEYLSSLELVRMLKNEKDLNRRWAMIEDNLRLGRPERVYPLLINFTDIIRDHVQHWPESRLKAAFATQPAAVLTVLMDTWRVNQVMALAEDHAERQAILDWLRDHEVERLLKLDTSLPIITLQQAREAMCVDATVESSRIKKIWRMQLGFLNADHGRNQERAIHRHKDEIAKYLQDARNKLTSGK